MRPIIEVIEASVKTGRITREQAIGLVQAGDAYVATSDIEAYIKALDALGFTEAVDEGDELAQRLGV